MFTLTQVAKSLKMSPKIARRKMRDNWPRRLKEWKFQDSQRKKVVAILNGKDR